MSIKVSDVEGKEWAEGYRAGMRDAVIHAHWRLVSLNLWDCTNCHYVVDRWDRKTSYCPDCGAKMDEDDI